MVAELIGDLATLLDRADTLTPTIDKSRLKMTAAAHELATEVNSFKAQMLALTEHTRRASVQNILNSTNAAAAKLLEAQTDALSASARTIVEKEVGPQLRQLASNLKQLVDRTSQPWDAWLAHAATAMASAMFSTTFVLFIIYTFPGSGPVKYVDTAQRVEQAPGPQPKISSAVASSSRRTKEK